MSAGYRPLSISNLLHSAARHNPAKVAISCETRSLTFFELSDRIEKVRQAISRYALAKGQAVALYSPNDLRYVELVAGLSAAGHPVVTINPGATEFELNSILEDSGSGVLFFAAELASKALAPNPPGLLARIKLDDEYEMWRDDRAHDRSRRAMAPVVTETDTFAISYTSGTTGRPKGVMISHRSRALTFAAMAAVYGCYTASDSALCLAPMSHGGGLAFALAPLVFGGHIQVLRRFDVEETLHQLARPAITSVFMVPTHFHALFQSAREPRAVSEWAHLKAIISNAAPLPFATKKEIVAQFGEGKLHECYGSTEAGIVSNLAPPDQIRKPHSVGLPFPYTEIAITDADGQDVSEGEIGEIWSRSPYLFNGYHGLPDDTMTAIRDGWCSAGDLGRIDHEGHLFIEGRKKDMVISGGVNIYPREIEECLATHADVADVAVVGAPDPKWGERVVAFITSRGGGVDAEALSRHCKQRLSAAKCPKEFIEVVEIPRNPTGKVLKRVLRDRFVERTTR